MAGAQMQFTHAERDHIGQALLTAVNVPLLRVEIEQHPDGLFIVLHSPRANHNTWRVMQERAIHAVRSIVPEVQVDRQQIQAALMLQFVRHSADTLNANTETAHHG